MSASLSSSLLSCPSLAPSPCSQNAVTQQYQVQSVSVSQPAMQHPPHCSSELPHLPPPRALPPSLPRRTHRSSEARGSTVVSGFVSIGTLYTGSVVGRKENVDLGQVTRFHPTERLDACHCGASSELHRGRDREVRLDLRSFRQDRSTDGSDVLQSCIDSKGRASRI